MKFRKKPVVIEAFCLGVDPIPDWFMDKVSTNECILRGIYRDLTHAEVTTLNGIVVAKKGEFVIKGVEGEIYPCNSTIFEATYEKVEVASGI